MPPRVGPGLRTLTLATGMPAFTAREGLLDLLRYVIERPMTLPSAEAMEEFVAVVGDRSGRAMPLFKAARGRGGKTRFVIDDERWHMSGNAELRVNRDGVGQLRIDLALNPTRWMAALPHTRVAELAELDAAELLRRRPSDVASITLDGNDNHIHGERWRAHAITKRDALLQIYHDAVETFLNRAFIDDPALPDGVRLGRLTLPASPSRAEVYQEFRAVDAPSAVETIRDAALAAISNTTAATYPLGQSQRMISEARSNTCSLRIQLSKTVHASIYAKTMRVVRVEICYIGDIREHAVSRRARGVALSGWDILAGLFDDAGDRTRLLLDAVAKQIWEVDVKDRKDAFDLLDQLHAATAGDRQHSRDLLSLLGNYGGLTETGPAGVAPSKVVRSLERNGVVQRIRYRHGNAAGGRRFTLTPTYADALPAFLATLGIDMARAGTCH